MLNSRPVRWARSKAGATYHRTVLARHPRVLCNSFPKSGTNLLIGLVTALPWMRSHGRGVTWHHVPRSLVAADDRPTRESAVAELRVCLPGEAFLGHVEAEPELMAYIDRRGFKTLFIYRDPRDVLVSLLHWWKRNPADTWQEPDSWPFRYFHALESDDDRLAFLIEGWPSSPKTGFPKGVDFPNIATRYGAFTPWIDEPSCLAVRFEDLRDPELSLEAMRGIARHLYPASSVRRLDELVAKMRTGADPSRSRTFRQGRLGGWRDEMTDSNHDLFKQNGGRLLVDLGYEGGFDW